MSVFPEATVEDLLGRLVGKGVLSIFPVGGRERGEVIWR